MALKRQQKKRHGNAKYKDKIRGRINRRRYRSHQFSIKSLCMAYKRDSVEEPPKVLVLTINNKKSWVDDKPFSLLGMV